MDEQVRVAGDVANAVRFPAVADGDAGFGDPLHTMRTVREFIRAGVGGIHIEDQLFPKRAHYHRAKGQTTTPPRRPARCARAKSTITGHRLDRTPLSRGHASVRVAAAGDVLQCEEVGIGHGRC